jgi:diguanylate cyclase (GGDEF)-like protein
MNYSGPDQSAQYFDTKALVHVFEQLWKHSSDPFWICIPAGEDFELLVANDAALRLDSRQIAGNTVRSIVGYGPEGDQLISGYHECMVSGEAVTFEQRPVLRGSERLFETLLVPVKNDAGAITHIWGMARDLTRFLVSQNALLQLNEQLEAKILKRTSELEEANKRLAELSMTDGLTGIANRRKFDAAIVEEWSRAVRTGSTLSLIMLDIDHFKKYNDHYGHQQGDDCLRRVADVLRAGARRQGDLVTRYGGEEFCMILPDTSLEGAFEIAERLRREVEELKMPHVQSDFGMITISLGVAASTPGKDQGPAELLRLADESLYRAKSEGRNCVRGTSPWII